MTFWGTVGASVLAVAIIGGPLALFLKHWLERRLAKLNGELQQQLSRFNRLHEVLAEKIPEIFTRVIEIERIVEQWFISRLSLLVTGDTERESRSRAIHQELMDRREALQRYVSQNHVYFGNSLKAALEEFDITFTQITIDIAQIKTGDAGDDLRKKCIPVWERQRELRNTISGIEASFKRLLGVQGD
ncbi:MAG: hypothetical protein QOK24_2067 [Verrucomicrobiota bacterium]|jgi:HAMP domain-containing protein